MIVPWSREHLIVCGNLNLKDKKTFKLVAHLCYCLEGRENDDRSAGRLRAVKVTRAIVCQGSGKMHVLSPHA